ncbi:MAG: carboxypeptidase-like regulatory domain-containing protein [Bacteroidales bacterium]|jgi:hypothetical protein|nr:carboxypeptidase-like regulatory domain-containing protein [Candidatus Cloacimonadota bacterium]MDD2571235.1 carboxypeptidase-like regulatory domain-containing protein [Bacteroidales bacterium]MDD3811404.1 carboxypeptidase-like regulatory domain-containing protein [Bacteroidales bacterium]MDD3872361.1 carboxypeptidase-like regulatory domain-containing protein [Bacteroidales bacterium]
MRKFQFLTVVILIVSTAISFAQTGSINGVVTDSLTGEPVANLTVFIPSTTYGTTTNQSGEYRLNGLNPGDYILIFRHLSYHPSSRTIAVNPGDQLVLNMQMAEQSRALEEVAIVGKLPEQSHGLFLINEFFLGDHSGKVCRFTNQKALSFYYEGDGIKATADQPLIITNQNLGYRITYFLDYFKYLEVGDSESDAGGGAFFGYAGQAVFEDLSSEMPLRAIGWKLKRNQEFKGSLRYFFACLYHNELQDNRYHLRKAYKSKDDLQLTERVSDAMAKIRFAVMDSLLSWDPLTGEANNLYYNPDEEFRFFEDQIAEDSVGNKKTLTCDSFLLVFYDHKRTRDLRDDFITTFQISGNQVVFDQEGNFWAPNGTVQWVNLDHAVQIKRLLPADYLPRM